MFRPSGFHCNLPPVAKSTTSFLCLMEPAAAPPQALDIPHGEKSHLVSSLHETVLEHQLSPT